MVLCYVRVARTEDSDELARLQLATWQVAYRRLIPRTVLDQLDVEWLSERWRDAVSAPPTPAHRVLAAVEQIETTRSDAGTTPSEPGSAYLVGFAASGPADAA